MAEKKTKRESKAKFWLRPENLDKIKKWAEAGETHRRLAERLGIGRNTFCTWLNKYPEFFAAVVEGKTKADEDIENALYKKATGFHYEETVESSDGKITTYKKYSAPDTKAAIFWLVNRKPDHWVNSHKIEANVNQKTQVDLSSFTTEELRSFITGTKDE